MDTDYLIDLTPLFEVIDTAEVIIFRFVIVPQRLLLDPRYNETEGPLLKLVPRANSLEERFKALKQLRPRFKLPEKISAIWWPKYVDSLVRLNVWERVVRRLNATGFPNACDPAEGVLRELRQWERAEVLNAITGKNYHALWEQHH